MLSFSMSLMKKPQISKIICTNLHWETRQDSLPLNTTSRFNLPFLHNIKRKCQSATYPLTTSSNQDILRFNCINIIQGYNLPISANVTSNKPVNITSSITQSQKSDIHNYFQVNLFDLMYRKEKKNINTDHSHWGETISNIC